LVPVLSVPAPSPTGLGAACMPYDGRSSIAVACLVAMAGANLMIAFSAPASRAPLPAPSVQPPRAQVAIGASQVGSGTSGADAAPSSLGPLAAAAAASALALGSRLLAKDGARRRARAGACTLKALGSSGSGFMGCPTASSSIVVMPTHGPAAVDDYSSRNGAGGMGMRNQVWWITGQTQDNRPAGQVFDWPRRESRRRGEELFRHDVDNFELTLKNLIKAPGSNKKKIRRGRGKYGNYGRSCGYGQKGAKTRGRRYINPGYEGGRAPLHIVTPKLLPEHKAMMKVDPYTWISLKDLNMCEDGEEVDYQDLFMRGIPVRKNNKYQKIRVKGEDTDEFTVKNLTVYAHAFEPPAREKIEALGGRCVRLHDWTSLPIDPEATKSNADDFTGAVAAADAPAEEEEEAPSEE